LDHPLRTPPVNVRTPDAANPLTEAILEEEEEEGEEGERRYLSRQTRLIRRLSNSHAPIAILNRPRFGTPTNYDTSDFCQINRSPFPFFLAHSSEKEEVGSAERKDRKRLDTFRFFSLSSAHCFGDPRPCVGSRRTGPALPSGARRWRRRRGAGALTRTIRALFSSSSSSEEEEGDSHPSANVTNASTALADLTVVDESSAWADDDDDGHGQGEGDVGWK